MAKPENGSPTKAPEQSPRSFRTDLICLIAGFLQLPLALFVWFPLHPSIPATISVSLTLLVLAFATGLVVGSKADWTPFTRSEGLAVATRFGATSGLIVSLVGSGMTVLAITIHLLREDIASDTRLWTQVSGHHIVAAVFCVVPTILAASLGCLSSASASLPHPDFLPNISKSVEGEPARWSKRPGLIPWALLLFVLSLLSPTMPQTTTPPPEPEVVANPPESPDDEIGDELPSEPPPPAFNYETPPGLLDAPASAWAIKNRDRLDGVDESGPVVLSPDSRYLAYRPTGRKAELVVFNLRNKTIVREHVSVPEIRAIAWSPDSTRIFCVCDTPGSPYWLLDALDGRSMQLPVWSSLTTYACAPVWRDTDQIHLVCSDDPRLRVLNLESLDVTTCSTGMPSSAVTPLPTANDCRISIVPRIQAYQPPPLGRQRGHLEAWFSLAVVDKRTLRAHRLPNTPVPPGTRFISTPDRSIFVSISNSTATIHYLGLGAGSDDSPTLTASMPKLPAESKASKLQDLIDSCELGVFVCAPLRNPLNDRVIGPNRAIIRGLAQVLSWEGAEAKLAMADTYSTIDESSVVTGLHRWKGGEPVLLDNTALRDWWSPVTQAAGTEEAEATRSFPRWKDPEFEARPAGYAYRGHSELFGRDGSLSLETTDPEVLFDDQTDRTASVEPQSAATKADEPLDQRISSFVRNHHEKVNRGDVLGYANDYSPQVDYYGQGIVSREDIFKEQAAYLPKYLRLSENPVGQVDYRSATGNSFHVTYKMHSVATRLDGSRSDKLIRIAMTIQATGNRFVILRERSELLEDRGS